MINRQLRTGRAFTSWRRARTFECRTKSLKEAANRPPKAFSNSCWLLRSVRSGKVPGHHLRGARFVVTKEGTCCIPGDVWPNCSMTNPRQSMPAVMFDAPLSIYVCLKREWFLTSQRHKNAARWHKHISAVFFCMGVLFTVGFGSRLG